MSKELTADEMFKELGYEQCRNISDDVCCLNTKNEDAIYFYENTKTFEKTNFCKIDNFEITMQELQAINKKVEELRMDKMTDEEKQTIRYCKNCLTKMILGQNPCFTIDTLETVLNLIEKQQKEIERAKMFLNTSNQIFKINNSMLDKKDLEIAKKDKIIDLMAEKIYEEGIIWDSKEEVKQYFEKEASKDE